MRALIFDGSSARLNPTYAAPPAQLGEAVVRLSKAAVSAADLEICRRSVEFTGVLGQQFVGIVESVNGPHATNLVGKRVVGNIATACAQCDMCLAGLSGHCRHRTILGLHKRDGCLAEKFVLPAKNLVEVPSAIDNDHAVFVTDLAAALQVIGQLTIANKPFITILGDDSVALLTAQL